MKRMAAVLAALVLGLPALAGAQEASALFSQKCASCHGKDGKGTPVGQKMGAKDLTASSASESEMENAIANGKGKMKGYKASLSEEQIKSLAKFIKSGLK